VVVVLWQKGRIVTAHGRFSRIGQVAPTAPLSNCTFLNPLNSSPHLKRHLDQFSHFCTADICESLYSTMAAPFPVQNCLFVRGGSEPRLVCASLAHPSPQPKQHLDWFSHFCRAHDHDRPTDQQTDHVTPSITVGCMYVRSTAMQPNNNDDDNDNNNSNRQTPV